MTGLIRADLIKLAHRKLYWVMLVILAFVVALTAFFLLLFPDIAPEEALAELPSIEKPDAYLFGVGQVLSQTWFPVILAVVFFGTETGRSIWASALTRESRRWLHLLSKVVVLTLAAWLAMLLAIAGWALVAALFAEGSGAPSVSAWLGVVWKAGLVELAWVSLSLAAISLLRSVGPAVGAGLAFTFGESILALWPPWQNVSLTGASYRVVGEFGDLSGILGAGPQGISFLHAMSILAFWAFAGVAFAVVGLQIRDP